MAYGPVNVSGASESSVKEVNDNVQEVSKKVGEEGDSNGSSTSGTVMGKLNKIISDITTHMGRWTSARASYIDAINTNTKNNADRIGATDNTGGSASAGTVMGKLNKLISDLSNHVSAWTSARAGNIDTINTNTSAIKTKTDTIGSTSDTGGSGSAGTVMGKLNKIISDIETHMGRWTSARAGYIDTINTNAKNSVDRIGVTGDTGGSTSAGTVMGKLNKLITDLTSHVSSWTSTRAGSIDTIKTNTDKIGTTGDTGGSATAGTIMGKLNKIISDLTTHMGRWTSTRAGYIDTINTNASAIKTKTDTIGTTGDTGGSDTAGTVFGKLNKLISDLAAHVSSWTSTRAGYIDTIKTNTEALMTNGAVKSVQRGTVTIEKSSSSATVTINTVNPDKCLVVLDGSAIMYATSIYIPMLPYIDTFSNTKLVIKTIANATTISDATNIISWQVIEYY